MGAIRLVGLRHLSSGFLLLGEAYVDGQLTELGCEHFVESKDSLSEILKITVLVYCQIHSPSNIALVISSL